MHVIVEQLAVDVIYTMYKHILKFETENAVPIYAV
jgi:hypothetical protein